MKFQIQQQPRHIQHLLISTSERRAPGPCDETLEDKTPVAHEDSLLDHIMSGLAWHG